LTAAFGALKKAVIWAGNAMPLSARPPAYPSETVVAAELAAPGVSAKPTVSDAREWRSGGLPVHVRMAITCSACSG
jgi:hypothetical protein